MTFKLSLAALCLALFFLSCKEKTIVESSTDSLIDPDVAPKVLFTYPPLNSVGPYSEWDQGGGYYSYPYEVRFNKLMNPPSVRRALSLRSTIRQLAIDTNYIYSPGREDYQWVLNGNYSGSYPYRLGEVVTLSLSYAVSDVNGNVILAQDLGTFQPEPTFRVRSMSPKDGSVILPGNFTLRLDFNSKIDASILPFVTVTPPLSGRWMIGLDSMTLSKDVQISGPTQGFAVVVGAGAPDRDGNHSAGAFSGRVSATPFLASTYYNADTIGVPLYRQYSLSFSYPVDTATFRSAFHVTPAVAGGVYLGMYMGPSYIPFMPYREYAPNTRYTVRVDTTLRSLAGFPLSKEFTFTFQTAPFGVIYTFPSDGLTGMSRGSSVSVGLSGYPDTASARRSFSIVPAAAVVFSSYSGAYYYYFSPSAPLLANTTYTVKIDTSLRSMSGFRPAEPYTFSFTTGE